MTELGRARNHLRRCQIYLAQDRRNGCRIFDSESDVLAALSWLWEQQEKEREGIRLKSQTGNRRFWPAKNASFA